MPAAVRAVQKTHLAYTGLALLFLISITYRARDAADRVSELLDGTEIVRDPFALDGATLTITRVQPESGEAGLKPGDVLLGIAGQRVTGIGAFHSALRRARAGDRLSVEVRASAPTEPRRAGTIELRPLRAGPPSAAEWLQSGVVGFALPFSCLALGFWVTAVRVRDRSAWLLLLMLLSLAEFVGGSFRSIYGRDDAFRPIAAAYQPLLANLWPSTMALFAIYFPERLALDRRHPWIKWILIGPLLLRVFARNAAISVLVIDHATLVDRIRRADPTAAIGGTFLLAPLVLFFVVMGYKRVTASSPDARRRLRLVSAGAMVGLTPILALFVVGATRGTSAQQLPIWTGLTALMLILVFPLTLAYTIVVERAMDVRVVVRQGLQYLLAAGGVRVLQVAVSALIILGAATMSASPNANLPRRITLISLGFASLVFIRVFAERLRRWVDRRFFREAYDAELILSDLANKVRTMVETGPLLEMVTQRISQSLHVPRVAIMLNGGGLQPACAVGYTELPRVAISDDSLDAEHERELRQTLQSELLLPLSANQQLIGVMSLGPKQSEEPFSHSDIRLLDSVATQTGLALANSRLTAAIAMEIASREKAKRELEIAREVQERLFPQEYPPIAGLEYAGACRPALEVGGDYYDFISLSGTELGIAIGDVSGKGIPAALLMATLRAYLRGQAVHAQADLAQVMVNLNKLVYESSASNRYATFFYGQYDSATRVLHYVNGGHNAPMVFRAASSEVMRLDTGGPVIGLIAGCEYEQARVRLEPGDVLVAYTDGVSEAMNAEHEEWGEENLMDTVRPNRALPSRKLIDRILAGADAFVTGAPQHDDMTVVVVRLV